MNTTFNFIKAICYEIELNEVDNVSTFVREPKVLFTFYILYLDFSASDGKLMANSNFNILSAIVFKYPNLIAVPCRHRVEVQ